MLAQIQARKGDEESSAPPAGPNPLAAMLQARGKGPAALAATKPKKETPKTPLKEGDGPFSYDSTLQAFLFFGAGDTVDSFAPKLVPDLHGQADTDILVPLAPCMYRMTDYTFAKKEAVTLKQCIIKLGVLRCLSRECNNLNNLLQHRNYRSSLEEEELGKSRCMELLSSCGVYQKVSELILKRAGHVLDLMTEDPNKKDALGNPLKQTFLNWHRLAKRSRKRRRYLSIPDSVNSFVQVRN
jgi:hypothetical protein